MHYVCIELSTLDYNEQKPFLDSWSKNILKKVKKIIHLISQCKLTSSILSFFLSLCVYLFFLSPHPSIANHQYYLMTALCEAFCCQVFMSRED
jgi:hypothetical protein